MLLFEKVLDIKFISQVRQRDKIPIDICGKESSNSTCSINFKTKHICIPSFVLATGLMSTTVYIYVHIYTYIGILEFV